LEHLAQVSEESVVVAHGFAGAVGELGHGLAVAFHQLEHDVQRLVPHVVGEVGADAEAGFEAVFEVLVQRPGFFQIEAVGEGEHFGAAVDFELAVVGIGFVAPNIGVAAVVAQAVEKFGEVKVEIAQKGVHADNVGERDANPMQLQELSLDIWVMGQTAVTTMEMTFYNPNDRAMEGAFEFPLSNGQEVSRFALDIDGKLREGVVVDKALGRQAFEDIARRNVDPGLLEKTEGNNFRARVYPMPAQGVRRILIAFEQELSQKDGRDFYFLPIASGVKLKHFKLRTEVVSRMVKADIENTLQLNFGQSRNSYISEVKKDNYTLDKNIGLTFPKIDKPQLLTATKGTDSYLYGNIALGKQSLREKEKPKRIGILWDCSSSSQKRDFAKEFALLDAYFKEIKEVKVALTTFHIRSSAAIPFKVENGNWQELRQYLEKLVYDGGQQILRQCYSLKKVMSTFSSPMASLTLGIRILTLRGSLGSYMPLSM